MTHQLDADWSVATVSRRGRSQAWSPVLGELSVFDRLRRRPATVDQNRFRLLNGLPRSDFAVPTALFEWIILCDIIVTAKFKCEGGDC